MARILILDDEPDMVESCRRILALAGYECLSTSDPQTAIAMLESERPDLLLTDLRMPAMDGFQLLRRAKEIDPLRPVIMFTAYATIESAVSAVREGAFDYLPKPFSLEQLRVAVERALTQRRLALENRHLREQLRETYGFGNIIGGSSALHSVIEIVRKAARTDADILIMGESGTGKELVARAIHANSPRAHHPFVAVDCASLPENLLESELFGHEKGSFTGASAVKLGLLEIADHGTVFLDEIGELPAGLQAKLLRFLQERRIRRVGGTREIAIDIRVLSASNRNLRESVTAGEFRDDLYYRVNVIDIALPPLRERTGDVSLLAQTFLHKYARSGGRELRGFTREAIALLEAHAWPGNVRELQNVVERACALADGDLITPDDLPAHLGARLPPAAPPTANHAADATAIPATPELADPIATLTLKEAKERWIGQLEAAYVAEVLRREGGNVSQAARVAGVDRKTLHRILSKHSLR
ncbi:MAG TPA: sigma-54 dependent transcriptional regulator [Candidatus Binataceae bacterium]|nr:sigma-54 dependent transcriptional regulator [Candidatus Binataceae bacterium]